MNRLCKMDLTMVVLYWWAELTNNKPMKKLTLYGMHMIGGCKSLNKINAICNQLIYWFSLWMIYKGTKWFVHFVTRKIIDLLWVFSDLWLKNRNNFLITCTTNYLSDKCKIYIILSTIHPTLQNYIRSFVLQLICSFTT